MFSKGNTMKNLGLILVLMFGLATILGSGGSDGGSPRYDPLPSYEEKVLINKLEACSCAVSYCGNDFYPNEPVKFIFHMENDSKNLDKLTLSFNGGSLWTAYPSSSATKVTSQCNAMNFSPGSTVSVVGKAYSNKSGDNVHAYGKSIKMLHGSLSSSAEADEAVDAWLDDSADPRFFEIEEEITE